MTVLVLGIETSCDETAVAVVEDGSRIHSNVIASQVEIHARYGGIIPEIASRQHVLQMEHTVESALEQAGAVLKDVSAIAVTRGPGLAGALLVGVNAAKGLAFALGVPLWGVNHLEGHIYATWLEGLRPDLDPGFPLICLVASGGHTDLILMRGYAEYVLLGRTRDDAAGEAFDKAARILGLGFPGGPAVQRVAQGVITDHRFPRARLKEIDSMDFSFSGLKTALLNEARTRGLYPPPDGGVDPQKIAQMAAAFQEAVVDVLVARTVEAVHREHARGIILGGGVAANTMLRQQVHERSPVPVMIPNPVLCTDNGAMVAACGFFCHRELAPEGWDMDIIPSLRLG